MSVSSSKDANTLCQPLHISILRALLLVVVGRRWRGHQVRRVGQRVVTGVLLPAAVVALVGYVTLPEL